MYETAKKTVKRKKKTRKRSNKTLAHFVYVKNFFIFYVRA
ncbi:hypothetical protein BSM4216_3365 [Bacillus smithii]|nr:hypothetical protein BSM4216_3365 [Bacillus smithii]